MRERLQRILARIRRDGPWDSLKYFLERAFWRICGHFLIHEAVRRFGHVTGGSANIEQALDSSFAFKFLGLTVKPWQIREEIIALLRLLEEKRPKTIIDIGTAWGGTLFLFTRVADPHASIISVDLPSGLFRGGYADYRAVLYRSFAREAQELHLVRGDSHSPETLEQVKKLLDGKAVDFLMIDGDHSYEGVKKDFEIYSPLVKPGGLIAFHDICGGPQELVGGVPRFWSEIQGTRRSGTFVKDANQGGGGIGIIYC